MDKEFGKLSVFDKIYAESYWGNGSGGGSSLEANRPYIQFIDNFINKFSISSIIDLGCGDWQFSKFINFGKADYLGIDVAKSIIKSNSSKYSNEKVSFMHSPNNYEEIPEADLLICKDVLMHLNYDEILKISKIFPKYKYCLITNDLLNLSQLGKLILRFKARKLKLVEEIYNQEIKIGEHRPLDLNKKPFCFKLKKVFEWDAMPLSTSEILNWKNLILGRKSVWKKRTYLYER